MVSRDTKVHLGAVVLGLAVVFLADYFALGPDSGSVPLAVFLLFYGLVLGGAHLYLALRDEDGMVPAEARWRYVGMVVVLLGAGATILYGGERTIATIELSTIAQVVIAVTVIGYFVTESVAGYRSSRPE